MIDIDLNQLDVNQCARDHQLFSGSNKCLPESTQVSSWKKCPGSRVGNVYHEWDTAVNIQMNEQLLLFFFFINFFFLLSKNFSMITDSIS